MKYHLYQRTITHKGQKKKVWYYWFYDESGKQIRKSCGTNGNPCTVKRAAQAFVESLPEDLENKQPTFHEFASGMYDADSKYLLKIANKKGVIKDSTRYHKERCLDIFLSEFGNRHPDEVSTTDIDDWLLEMDCSNSWRNHIISVIDDVYKEMYIKHIISYRPLFERYKRNDETPKGIIYPNEIVKLFPQDTDELVRLWRVKGEPDSDCYMFATLIYTILSTGMRSCEIRALQWNQFVQSDAILLNAMVDSLDDRVDVLKKGTVKNKKWRVAILPEKTVRMIQNMKLMQNCESDYVFTHKGERVSTWFLLNHFRCVLKQNNIDWKERNIGIHSLRFTYNTMMKREISGDDLRLMMGHTNAIMTEYYDKSTALDNLPSLIKNKGVIDSIFN